MSAAVVNEKRVRFDALPSPEVSSAEVGNMPRGKGFANRVVEWLKDKNTFGIHTNDETGWDIKVNKATVKDVAYHGGRNGKIALLSAVPLLINNGIYLETNPKNSRGLTSHVFAAKAIVDGELYAVSFVVREDVHGRRYYDHSLTKIKALDRLDSQAPCPANMEDQRLRAHTTPVGGSSMGNEPIANILKKHLGVNTQSKKM